MVFKWSLSSLQVVLEKFRNIIELVLNSHKIVMSYKETTFSGGWPGGWPGGWLEKLGGWSSLFVGTPHSSNIRLGRALVGYGVDVEVIFPVAKMELC